MTDTKQDYLSKPVLVTGASGFVGSHIARLLAQQGRKLRVLVRKTSNIEAIADLGADIRYGDVLDPDSIRAATEGCGSVFHCVVDPRFWLSDPTPIYRNNVEGACNVMDAALACGVQRFIFTSTIGTLGLNPTGPVSEETEFNWHDKASSYILARLEAEKQFMNYCRDKNLPGVALCISITYGPQDFQPTPHGKMLWEIASGKVKHTLDASAPTVDIRDTAEAALAAEQHGKIGERYIISNEFVSNKDLYQLAVSERGTAPPKLISLKIAYAAAWVTENICKLIGKKDNIATTNAVFLSTVFREMDNSKARRDLHWTPRPIRDTVKDAVAWYAQREAQSGSSAP